MSTYQEILQSLKKGKCDYGNELTEVSYSLGHTKMKIKSNGDLQFF